MGKGNEFDTTVHKGTRVGRGTDEPSPSSRGRVISWEERWQELETEALAYGVTSEQYWGDLTPTQVGELLEFKREKELELAYYQAIVTAQATWGKAPEKPQIREKREEKKEQTEEELLMNLRIIKERNKRR